MYSFWYKQSRDGTSTKYVMTITNTIALTMVTMCNINACKFMKWQIYVVIMFESVTESWLTLTGAFVALNTVVETVIQVL